MAHLDTRPGTHALQYWGQELQAIDAPAWLGLDGRELLDRLQSSLGSQHHRERWKYTKPAALAGVLSTPTQTVSLESKHVGVELITHANSEKTLPCNLPDFQHFIDTAPEAVISVCRAEQVAIVVISSSPPDPVSLTYAQSAFPTIIVVEDGVTVQIEERYQSMLAQQQSTWIIQGSNSQVTHSRNRMFQQDDAAIATLVCFSHLSVDLGKDARYTLHNHSLGSKVHRQEIHINCRDSGGHAELNSAALVGDSLHLDQQVTLQHCKPNTSSQQTVHNVAGNNAKVTFNGRIHIHKHAAGTAAHLSNKNLAVGNNATINTKPELEIYNDDVQCSHGATIGQIDNDQIFYCASRGISEGKARALLAQAFLTSATKGSMQEEALSCYQTLQSEFM